MVRGPSGRSIAGCPPSLPGRRRRASRRRGVLAEIRRTTAPDVQYSGRWTEDWTIRYGHRLRQPSGGVQWPSIPSRASRSVGPGSRSRGSGSAARRSAGCSARSPTTTRATIVRRAWDLGIRYFDTAPLYGYGDAERRIGSVLARPAARRVRALDEGRPARPDAGRDRPRRRASTASASTAATTPSMSARGPERIVFDYSRRRRPAVDRGEPGAARARPDRHRPHPRPGRPLAGRDRRGVPGPRQAPRAGRDPGHRRRHEPVGDARPLRPRDRHRRVPPRRPLHAARPGRARRAAAGLRASAASRCSSAG